MRIVVETTEWREDPEASPQLKELAGSGILARPRSSGANRVARHRALHELVTVGVLTAEDTAALEEELAAGIGSAEELRGRIASIRENKLLSLRRAVRKQDIDATALDAIADLVERSRVADLRINDDGDVLGDLVRAGIGPRGAQALALAGKVEALLAGDPIVLAEHLHADAAAAALAHRLPLEFAAERLGPHPGVEIVKSLVGSRKGARSHAVVAS